MNITILDGGKRKLCKTFRRNPITKNIVVEPYGNMSRCTATYHAANNIYDLYDLLLILEPQPTKCLIRGSLKSSADIGKLVTRRLHDREGEPAPFEPNPNNCNWLMVDIDNLANTQNLTNLNDLGAFALQSLPSYFHNATHVRSWSSSFGVFNFSTIKCHLWFWTEQPFSDREYQNWAKSTNRLIDPAPFRTVQPNYTAAPRFEGMPDPIGNARTTLVSRTEDTVSIPWDKSYHPAFAQIASNGSTNLPALKPGQIKFDQYLTLIGNPEYHYAIIKAIGSWVSSTGPASDYGRLKQRLRNAVQAGAAQGSQPKSFYMSDNYLDAQIRNCHFQPRPNGPTRLPETKQEVLRYKLSKGERI